MADVVTAAVLGVTPRTVTDFAKRWHRCPIRQRIDARENSRLNAHVRIAVSLTSSLTCFNVRDCCDRRVTECDSSHRGTGEIASGILLDTCAKHCSVFSIRHHPPLCDVARPPQVQSYDLTTSRRVIYRHAFSDSVLTPQLGQLNTGVGTVMRAIGRRLLSRLGAVWVLSHIIMVLLGTIFLGTWSRTWIGVGLAEGIGGSLIASGVAGVSLFLYVSFTDTLRAQIETISKAGLSTIYSGRSVQIRDAYHHRLTAARTIDLIGYGLSSFRQDYLEHFVDWSRRCACRKSNPEILMMQPAQYRSTIDVPYPLYGARYWRILPHG
jgi:hypothetical protein